MYIKDIKDCIYKNIFSDRKLSEERPHVMLNQFPCESLVTVKDCLASVARRVKGGPTPDWLPETFNLQTELPQFVKHYQLRQQRFDSYFKESLNMIITVLAQPKICCF